MGCEVRICIGSGALFNVKIMYATTTGSWIDNWTIPRTRMNQDLPRYNIPAYPRFRLGGSTVHILKVVDFLRYVVVSDQLDIRQYLGSMSQDPFFLVAATGLGKTVAVPIHVLIRVMEEVGARADPHPRVWVVEPRIPIAVDQAKFMNILWKRYLASKSERPLPALFGSISSRGKDDPDAPIRFVTTGIFELAAKRGELDPGSDRVIIDEAHVTVEQNAGVELGIAIARRAGVTVDYMSATVDTSSLAEDLNIAHVIRADQQRYPIWKHNLTQPMHEALPHLIKATLINPDPRSAYFPQPDEYANAQNFVTAATEPGRSHGLLVVVNSFAGEHSDAKRLEDVLRRAAPDLAVLQLAGEVVRDARRIARFESRLRAIENAAENYVIIATSVVEMGITFPTLDFVATMDSGYDQETVGDQTFPVLAPLGVNSLLQRIGRVGRRRPGVAYISNDVGAEYASIDDLSLNRNGLQYESIRFPLISSPLIELAYYACSENPDSVERWVATLELPSRLHENADRMSYLDQQIEVLRVLGMVNGNKLTPLGQRMERWVGQADLAYAVKLQNQLETEATLPEIMFWTVATALSNTPIRSIRAQHDFFLDYDGVHKDIDHDVDIWSGFEHEDIAAFGAICYVIEIAPLHMVRSQAAYSDDWDDAEVRRWCGLTGIDFRKVRKALDAVSDVWRLFCRINAENDRFIAVIGETVHGIESLPWSSALQNLHRSDLQRELNGLPGCTTVTIETNEDGPTTWTAGGGRGGLVHQDDSPIRLVGGDYASRLVPRRESREEVATWQLAHVGTLPVPEMAASQALPPAPAPSEPKKRWWEKILDVLGG